MQIIFNGVSINVSDKSLEKKIVNLVFGSNVSKDTEVVINGNEKSKHKIKKRRTSRMHKDVALFMKPWTQEDEKQLLLAVDKGMTWVEIARQMGRSQNSVHVRYYRIHNNREDYFPPQTLSHTAQELEIG